LGFVSETGKYVMYNDARKFRRRIYEVTNKFPKNEIYGLADQARRAKVFLLKIKD
jgi:hypothetical protein